MNMIVGAAASTAAATATPAPADASADPIFVAIKAHKEANRRFDEAFEAWEKLDNEHDLPRCVLLHLHAHKSSRSIISIQHEHVPLLGIFFPGHTFDCSRDEMAEHIKWRLHRHEDGTEPFMRGATKKKLKTLAVDINARFDEAERHLEEKKRSIPGVVEAEAELKDAKEALRTTEEALLRFPATTVAGMAAAFEYLGQLSDSSDFHVEDSDFDAATIKAAHRALRRLASAA